MKFRGHDNKGAVLLLISAGEISGGLTPWMPGGVTETEGIFSSRSQLVGASDAPSMQQQKDACPWVGGLVRGHIAMDVFSRGMLPVPRSHHSPCSCPRCLAAHPLCSKEEEEKWGDWGPLPACLPPSRCWNFTPCTVLDFFIEQIRQASGLHLTADCRSYRRKSHL